MVQQLGPPDVELAGHDLPHGGRRGIYPDLYIGRPIPSDDDVDDMQYLDEELVLDGPDIELHEVLVGGPDVDADVNDGADVEDPVEGHDDVYADDPVRGDDLHDPVERENRDGADGDAADGDGEVHDGEAEVPDGEAEVPEGEADVPEGEDEVPDRDDDIFDGDDDDVPNEHAGM